MASSHLLTLKAMCLNADIMGKTEQREALGWALARLTELSGSRVADALKGRPTDAVQQELREARQQIERLDGLIEHICYLSRSDRQRMERTFDRANPSL